LFLNCIQKGADMKKSLLVLVGTVLLLSVSGQARAATVAPNVDGFASYGYNGVLEASTKAAFSFSLEGTSFAPDGTLMSRFGGVSSSSSIVSGMQMPTVYKTGDLFINLAWNDSLTSATATFINYTKKALFLSVGLFSGTTGAGTFTSSLTTSAVPLPAALPLFGLGIASLAGYASRKKKQDQAA